MRALHGFDKVRVWIKGPDWGHPPAPEVTRARQTKHAVKLSKREVTWLAVNFVLAILLTTALMWNQALLPLPEKAAIAAFLLLTMASWGALLEHRRWLVPVEVSRVVSMVAAVLLVARA